MRLCFGNNLPRDQIRNANGNGGHRIPAPGCFLLYSSGADSANILSKHPAHNSSSTGIVAANPYADLTLNVAQFESETEPRMAMVYLFMVYSVQPVCIF